MTALAQPSTVLKSDEDRLVEIEGRETADQYMRTLEELIYTKSLSQACKIEGCLSERTFHRVKNRSREAWQLYTRARSTRADHRFDNLLERLDKIKDPQRARVMLEAEKWLIGKQNKGLYGDDMTINGDIQHHVTHTVSSALDEIRKRLDRKRKAIEGGVIKAIEDQGRGDGAPTSHIPASHTQEPTLHTPATHAHEAPGDEIPKISAESGDVTPRNGEYRTVKEKIRASKEKKRTNTAGPVEMALPNGGQKP